MPAALRKVAAYTGGRLPPPLARKLVHALEDSWLRAKAVDELPARGERDESAAKEASSLFLERPEGWWSRLADLGNARAESGADREREDWERKADALKAKLEEVRKREKAARAAAEDAAVVLRRDLDEARRRLRVTRGGERREIETHLADTEEARRLAAEAAHREARAGRYADRLRADLRRARKEFASAERSLESARSGGAARGDSLELARRLDETAVLARTTPGARAGDKTSVAPSLELPSGVRPDTAEAVEWLVAGDSRALVLVDGYNVSFGLSDRDFSTGDSRDRLNHELARLATRSPHLRVVVVYDSSLAGESSTGAGPGGVEVVFAAGDRLADEEVVEMASEATGPTVVVSSDREVREGAERAGALALWAGALVAWIRKRS